MFNDQFHYLFAVDFTNEVGRWLDFIHKNKTCYIDLGYGFTH